VINSRTDVGRLYNFVRRLGREVLGMVRELIVRAEEVSPW